ncbi:hypothetical protein [Clavibacter nebraskensis]|uniref:Lipoprotein n=1 Tax=Clavibacter nebraskensis TaxID=31963 RepID=A0ABY4MPD7_9MICO|nr:hypothetical protein [Clavibacter nebraskensis]KXU21810.1 hypothetical protein VV38_00250 [Clavibacter nebraskensis]OAH18935.1 hypothetical protein A3Q38_10990 [Clavibacter nebraskensis]QGV65489.1 hypothetical protein EGX36_00560 [Clavibacter nebraskensis]QGV68287.1 hypothetical protein EGX37_00560 [Clavibacter nebraskensis]QGV71080.1 hypothetical protein EGX35_00560 [Clavibacter nebraskensis]
MRRPLPPRLPLLCGALMLGSACAAGLAVAASLVGVHRLLHADPVGSARDARPQLPEASAA